MKASRTDSFPAVRRVAIVEDHVLQRRRTEEILGREGDLLVVASCGTLPEFSQWLERAPATDRPDLLVLDLSVDRGPSADPTTVRRLVNTGIRVLVLSALASPALVRTMIRAGVAGVVGKHDTERAVVDAVWTVLRDGEWITADLASVIAADASRPVLSDQEERVLVLYASGLTLEGVAAALGIRPETAKTYLARTKAKYAAAGRPARSKVELSRVAIADGYLDPRLRG